MKNVSSLKTNIKNESPKTPGGISKSLLTPCRRVGLSRNYKKKGPSPFISPLNSNTPTNVELKEEKKQTRKRKSVVESELKSDENNIDSDKEEHEITGCTNDIAVTPLRNVDLPRRKKSKTFLATLNSQENTTDGKSAGSIEIDDCTKENIASNTPLESDTILVNSNPGELDQEVKEVSPSPKPDKTIQKAKKLKSSLKSMEAASAESDDNILFKENTKETKAEVAKPIKKKSETKPAKTRSPNELTKECIVVIQKKLLKNKERYSKNDKDIENPKEPLQLMFDSDTDDVPLSTLNKKDDTQNDKPLTTLDNDNDDEFVTTKNNKSMKKESKKVANKKAAVKSQKAEPKPVKQEPTPLQSSFDDEDDFFDKKRTILIRKSYDKVTKPSKAKSTGSITQKDIDNLRARIEVKKKMLLGKAMTVETEELRTLIKKWQKGCQEALMELMDLMKIICPDKHNMDYSEILQMLKIPPSLVGYDSDHDCFLTPDDSSAVLSKYNDY